MKKEFDPDNGIEIDDRMVRFVGVPFFGLVIPSATGLINTGLLSKMQLFCFYGYFVFLAWIVWEGNRYLWMRFHQKFTRNESSLQKYIAMISINVLFTALTSLIMLFGWRMVCGVEYVGVNNVLIANIVIVVSVIFITNVYDQLYFTKSVERHNVKFEQLEKAKLQAEIEALKNQIDPHFVFNALNSLSYLIEDNPGKAQIYTENLAEVYRYILRSKNKDLVLLQDEIAFVKCYRSLLELRYEDAFDVNLEACEKVASEYLIPPVSLMVALENAVKHNEVSRSCALVIVIDISGSIMRIRNKVRERKAYKESTKTGLKNLDERFSKILGSGVNFFVFEGHFILEMPLLKLHNV